MQVGDLVIVKNTTTGDSDNMVRLYRERVPLLLVEDLVALHPPTLCMLVLDTSPTRFPRLQIEAYRLEVISHASR
jgi:hypothetical protein